MKIVIDVPEERYKAIQRIAEVQLDRRTDTVEQIVANGTPLPKGHGRLIDADMLPICHGVFLPRVNGNALGCPEDAVFVSDIEDAPTIIEADEKGEEE